MAWCIGLEKPLGGDGKVDEDTEGADVVLCA